MINYPNDVQIDIQIYINTKLKTKVKEAYLFISSSNNILKYIKIYYKKRNIKNIIFEYISYI